MINFRNGFTLIELMVTVSIVSVIMSTVLFNYSSFTDKLALSSAAQEIAIAIRQAQSYGINVRDSAREYTTTKGLFQYPYGVYFDLTDTSHYYIFVDQNNNGKYDAGSGCGSGTTECVEQGSIRNRVTLTSICDASCPLVNASKLSVTYLRPNPDAIIKFYNSSGTLIAGPGSTGKIVLTSPKGNASTITIEKTSQVSVI